MALVFLFPKDLDFKPFLGRLRGLDNTAELVEFLYRRELF